MNCKVTNNITTTKATDGELYYVEPAFQFLVILNKGGFVRFVSGGKTVTAKLTSNGIFNGYGTLYTLECLACHNSLESLLITPNNFAGLNLEILSKVSTVDNF